MHHLSFFSRWATCLRHARGLRLELRSSDQGAPSPSSRLAQLLSSASKQEEAVEGVRYLTLLEVRLGRPAW